MLRGHLDPWWCDLFNLQVGAACFNMSHVFPLKDTIWLFNIAMENGPLIDDFPTKTSIYKGFSMAMLNNQMVF